MLSQASYTVIRVSDSSCSKIANCVERYKKKKIDTLNTGKEFDKQCSLFTFSKLSPVWDHQEEKGCLGYHMAVAELTKEYRILKLTLILNFDSQPVQILS